ncbi:hypothetical protein MOUN0_F01816 [Monosporozyma unispora]|nr:hypothetical protein C6P44_003804 [Kazachstania unispora]
MTRTIKVIKKRPKKFGKKVDPVSIQRAIWTAGHLTILIFGLLFSVTYFFHVLLFFKYRSWKWLFLRVNHNYSIIKGHRWYHAVMRFMPELFFRFSLIGVFITSGVTMFQNWSGLKPTWYDLLSSPNFQTTLIAGLWFVGGGKSFYKLLPFMLISFLHLKNRKVEVTKEDEKTFDELTLENKHILHVLAYSEIFILFTLFLDTILLKTGTSGFLLVFYTCFFWLRLNFAPYIQVTVLRLLAKTDKKIPPKYVSYWETFRRFVYAKIKQLGIQRQEASKRT